MPEIPIILPMIVLGLAVGSIVKSKSSKISKKKLSSASLAAGLSNSIHAYLLYLLTPTQVAPRGTVVSTTGTFTPPTTGAFPLEGIASTSEASFVVASFLAAFFVVFLVLGIAALYARPGKGEDFHEAAEVTSETSEEEATLTSS